MAERKIKKKVEEVKKTVKSTVQKRKTANPNTVSDKLKLMVTIVARNKAEYYLDLIQSFDVNMQVVLLGKGTATAKTLDLLGLTNNDKAVILSVIQESRVSLAMGTLDYKFKTIKDGKGIACTLPFSSVIGTLIYGFLSNNRLTVREVKQ